MFSATREQIEHYGQKRVWFVTEELIPVSVLFEVANVRQPLLSADRLLEQRLGVTLKHGNSRIGLHDGRMLGLRRRRGLFVLRVLILSREPIGDHVVANISGSSCELQAVADLEEIPEREAAAPEPRSASESAAPNEVQRKKHTLLRLPHAQWCPECIQGRGRDDAHLRASPLERETAMVDSPPWLQIDFTYLDEMTVLGAYDMSLGHGFVTGVASKGVNPYAVQWLVQATVFIPIESVGLW